MSCSFRIFRCWNKPILQPKLSRKFSFSETEMKFHSKHSIDRERTQMPVPTNCQFFFALHKTLSNINGFNWHLWIFIRNRKKMFCLLFTIFFVLACDQNFISTTNIKSKNGTFLAPTFLNPEGHVRQCTYNFRALPGTIVKKIFLWLYHPAFRRKGSGDIWGV